MCLSNRPEALWSGRHSHCRHQDLRFGDSPDGFQGIRSSYRQLLSVAYIHELSRDAQSDCLGKVEKTIVCEYRCRAEAGDDDLVNVCHSSWWAQVTEGRFTFRGSPWVPLPLSSHEPPPAVTLKKSPSETRFRSERPSTAWAKKRTRRANRTIEDNIDETRSPAYFSRLGCAFIARLVTVSKN